ncbi:MAG: glycosyltransferase [Candidatus Heimdallarchaeota archaeon]
MWFSYPKIGVVIVGINVERHLAACIESVFNSDYPTYQLNIVYVDGGSNDTSVEIAKSFPNVKVLELNDKAPTPGKGRNLGWKAVDGSWVQFLDADTVLHPQWLKRSINTIGDEIGAVCGKRQEKFPRKNVFHLIGNLEWRYEQGPCRYFGGDVLYKKEILSRTGGFDENLVGGEDPELSYRIRKLGWEIFRLNEPMTVHDLEMNTFRQYFKRAFRSGYSYAEISLRFLKEKEKLWAKEFFRILVRFLVPIGVLVFFLFFKAPIIGVISFTALFAYPFARIPKFRKQFESTWFNATLYALHSSFVILPQFFGIVRYSLGFLFNRPLTNKHLIKAC